MRYLSMIELILFAIASTIIARYLEKAKFVVATIAHVVLFTVAFVIELLASDIAVIQGVFINLMGESTYEFVHGIFASSSSHLAIGYSVFFFVEIATILSMVLAAMIAVIRGYKKIVSKKLRITRPMANGPLMPAMANNAPASTVSGPSWNYISLGRLRN